MVGEKVGSHTVIEHVILYPLPPTLYPLPSTLYVRQRVRHRGGEAER